MQKAKSKKRKASLGFTLIELLVVISIIAVLSTIGLTTYQGIQSKARDSVRKQDLNTLATALEIYFQKNGKYPLPQLPQLGEENCNRDTDSFYSAIKSYLSGDVPKDPKDKTTPYCYVSQNNGQSFRLFAKLENCTDSQNSLCLYNYNYSVVSADLTITQAQGDTLIASTPTTAPTTAPTSAPTTAPTSAPTTAPTTAPTAAPTLTYKRVFVTSTTYRGGEIGGLSEADAKCQDKATAANLGGTWKAWISDSTVSAKDRLTHHSDQYKLVDGTTVVADNWTDLITIDSDGVNYLKNPIIEDENGIDVKATTLNWAAWTGTDEAGSGIASANNNCGDWKDVNNEGTIGLVHFRDVRWTNLSPTRGCGIPFRLYCFEQ